MTVLTYAMLLRRLWLRPSKASRSGTTNVPRTPRSALSQPWPYFPRLTLGYAATRELNIPVQDDAEALLPPGLHAARPEREPPPPFLESQHPQSQDRGNTAPAISGSGSSVRTDTAPQTRQQHSTRPEQAKSQDRDRKRRVVRTGVPCADAALAFSIAGSRAPPGLGLGGGARLPTPHAQVRPAMLLGAS
eukprot:1477283-Rhodomonas_salina.1